MTIKRAHKIEWATQDIWWLLRLWTHLCGAHGVGQCFSPYVRARSEHPCPGDNIDWLSEGHDIG